MPENRLYWYPGTCARIPCVALEEIGEPFEVVLVDIHNGRVIVDAENETERDYRAVNAKVKVPALVSDGRTITENPVIALYLARRYPQARLLPIGDPQVELDVLEMMCWFEGGIHPPITRQRLPHFFCDVPDAFDSIRIRARDQLEEAFSIVEDRLGDSEWLFGDWSLLDVHLLWLWFRATGAGMDGAKFPRCAAHARRCEARETVAKVLDREEAERARLEAAGRIPDYVRPHQVGRAPVFI